MKSFKLLLLPITLSLGISAMSYAQPGHHSPLREQLRHLQLDQTQRVDVRTLLKQWKGEREVYAGDKSVLREIIEAPEWDAEVAKSALQQLTSEEKAWARAQMQQAIWNLLNEQQQQQQQQWQAMLQEQPPREGPDPFSGRWMKRLNLSAQQTETLSALRSEALVHKAEEQQLKQTFMAEQMQLIADGDFNQSAFLSLYQQYQPRFEALGVEKLRHRHQFFQLLEDEQREVLQQVMRKRQHAEGNKPPRLSSKR
ncbi:hypothetical protein [Lacimicrobium sp. SS2-24]|uniref:Spy/CpxP family protein refolding chaperone n=1 Tax=Lacimicrobium sp. SS2-24 TaxID=2005569 RepID=UPI000B4C15BD|nr:hypothetical protein [Lacimicrobium sp. SS2-24]